MENVKDDLPVGVFSCINYNMVPDSQSRGDLTFWCNFEVHHALDSNSDAKIISRIPWLRRKLVTCAGYQAIVEIL